jgi:putative endopeptidase
VAQFRRFLLEHFVKNKKVPLVLIALLPLSCAHNATSASSQTAGSAGPSTASAAPAPSAYHIDESKLPTSIRFMAADLDPQKSPCADFAGHVNSKFLAAHPIPADRTTYGSFEVLAERSLGVLHQLAEQAAARPDATGIDKIVGDFYASGMDEAKIEAQGLEPLRTRLAAIDALSDGPAIAEYLRTIHARGEGQVFSFDAEVDFNNPDQEIAYAAQGGLGLPDKTFYFDADKKDKLAAYEKHVAAVLALAGASPTDAAAQAKDVLAFETRLAKASKSEEELARDVSLAYNPVTLAQADQLTPAFSWTQFFAAQGVAAPDKLSLAMPAFHQEVNALLAKPPMAQWKSYLRFHTIDDVSPYLSSAFVKEHFAFNNQAMRGQKEMKARWKRVLGAIDEQAGEALGQLYVQVAFSPEAKARMEELVKNLHDSLRQRLEALTWMSPTTKQRALDKWAAFHAKIGYPDKWRDYSGLHTSRDSYLGNVLAATEVNYKRNMAKIGKPVDRSEWNIPPQTVNANYNPLRNEITFPAAILQPPFFDPKADDAVNYGGIGAVIGHEMVHGYDDQGSRFGPTGRFENWWTAEDANGFASRTKQLVAQFDGYEALPGAKVSGNLTLGENIADLGGITIAYGALMHATQGKPDAKVDGMARDQRFFYAWGTVWRRLHTAEDMKVRLSTDPHAPARFRAVGAPSNLEEFAHAFGCKAGDPMVRSGSERIVIW